MISLTVTLDVHEQHLDAFRAAIAENALRSFSDEPGCVRFDVNQVVYTPTRFVFYELYADLAALDAHRAAPHFATWRRAADAFVVAGSQINTISELLITHDSNAPKGPS
ncbi:putative quinol monooxygenase [Microbacterium sp. DT81.1]|uniref:putative quinol monooxygenase n=1 Tax=Microbacterium sp. DT81.1 TaxID=3393413 RepID=UPI003CFA36DD